MSTDWSPIKHKIESLFTHEQLEIEGVLAKKETILASLTELEEQVSIPNQTLEEINTAIQSMINEYAKDVLLQLDSAQGLIEAVSHTKATIKKDEALKKSLDLELLQLRVIHRNLNSECQERRDEREKLGQEKNQLEQELSLEIENIDRYREAQASTQEQIAVLEEEAKILRTENAKLQTRLKHLQENIEGMKRLKEEHMLSIMQNTETLSKISSGSE